MADWFDLDTWKSFAESLSLGQRIFASVVAIATAIGTVLLWFASPFRWLASKLRPAKPAAPSAAPAPERQLRFVVDDHSTFHTPIGSDEKTGTHVIGVWDVTNISDRAFVLLKVKLGGHASKSATVGVESSRDPSWVVKGPLRAHRMSRVRIELAFTPAIHVPGEDLIVDVIFTDNYEGEHRVPGVRFPRFTPRAS